MSKMDEMILAIPRKELFGADDSLAFQGVHRSIDLLGLHTPTVKRRGDLEEAPNFKQLITYCVIRERETGQILLYERIGGGDSRLHLKSSIGVGGHANPIEEVQELHMVMKANALRELDEELNVKNLSDLELFGFINDDSDAVGRVHVGVVYLANVPSQQDVKIRETEKLRMRWVSKADLQGIENLENWSKLLVPYL